MKIINLIFEALFVVSDLFDHLYAEMISYIFDKH